MNYFILIIAIIILMLNQNLSFLPLVNCGEIIQSQPITNWGTWGPYESCPNGTFIQGFQVKTQPYRGLLLDDTAVNGIRLFCGDPENQDTPTITSSGGPFGSWGQIFTCQTPNGTLGHLYGFQLRVERPFLIDNDETATSNVRFFCDTNQEEVPYIEGDGLNRFGDWRTTHLCSKGRQALCTFQTQVQDNQGILRDDTALNNVLGMCCDLPSAS